MRYLSFLLFSAAATWAAAPKFDTVLYGASYYHEYMPVERPNKLPEKVLLDVLNLTGLTGPDQQLPARLYVKQNGRDLDFDARPSDAIALAVRVECPIFVATEVMETAGIIPEADEIDGDKDKTASPVVDEERLAVFRDFVNSLQVDVEGEHREGPSPE